MLSSQALCTLWDLQKLLFQLGPIFNPQEDFLNKGEFIQNVKANNIFQEKVLRVVLERHQELGDEPLCASLLALKKMHYELSEYEPLVAECINRKNTLCLPGIFYRHLFVNYLKSKTIFIFILKV